MFISLQKNYKHYECYGQLVVFWIYLSTSSTEANLGAVMNTLVDQDGNGKSCMLWGHSRTCHATAVLDNNFVRFIKANNCTKLNTWKVWLRLVLIRTRSTQRAQTSLAEADHYSHIAHCKNVEPRLWKTTHPPKKKKKKKKKKVLDHYLHHESGYATTITVFFCSFTHLTIPRSPPKI